METMCWVPAELCDDCCGSTLDGMTPEQRAMFEQMAAHYLWAATGKRYGLCETTYRPCRSSCGDYWGGLPRPSRVNGVWLNLACGTCSGTCGCDSISEVTLPNVQAVLAITEDGIDLDPFETVQVFDHRRLIRIDGAEWPTCQNLSVPDGPGTWSVTVSHGTPVPAGGGFVTGLLMCELAKACVGADDCRLPGRLQSLSRQGVDMEFVTDTEPDKLMTGLWEVDAWINAARSTNWRQPTLRSPDVPRPSVLTWPLELPESV